MALEILCSIWFVWLGVRGRWVGGWYVPERLLCSSMCRAFILHTASRLRDSAHGTDPSGQYSGSFPYLCAHARNSAECVCAGVVDAGIPARCRGRRDRVRAISHGRNRRPRALDDRARARGRRERRLESAERRGGGPRRATSRRGTSHACSHEHRQGREDLRGVKRRPPGCPGVPTRAPHRVAGFARACSARRGTACPRVESVPETVTAGGRRRKRCRFGPE